LWTLLMSLLLAVLPAEGLSMPAEAEGCCASCRCCVQTNTNPSPFRNAPSTVAKTVRVDREVRTEPQSLVVPAFQQSAHLPSLCSAAQVHFPSVALFERHCSLLI
ncbi:MAG TPA: hypothetical protein VM735_02840, partial [Candidatus Kapabacteria bacterium]|nr:hypothetical protein [Candidatus Kapabacteria bacterium]